MPINRLLKDSKLEPEKVERLNRAYSYALHKLRLVDRNDPIVDIIAKKIIEVGARQSRNAICNRHRIQQKKPAAPTRQCAAYPKAVRSSNRNRCRSKAFLA